jgi:transcriptional regulator with XRE-family HTH domain
MPDRRKTSQPLDIAPADLAAEARGADASGNGVDSAGAEAFIADKRIGVRLKRSMGLVELGRQTGLSASFLSQLETGRVVPTLRNLARIALVFDKDLSYFFNSEPQPVFRIHRKNERVRLPQSGVENPTYYFESMGHQVPDRHLDPYLAVFLPQAKPQDVRPHVHPGYEFLYILEGELEIQHADKTHILEAGDGVYFDANVPHSYRCHGADSAQVIIVTMHQGQVQQAQNTVRTLAAPRTPIQPTSNLGTRTQAGGSPAFVQAPRGSEASL